MRHIGGSVCGRGLSANPVSTIGFERRHNRALSFADEDAFAAADKRLQAEERKRWAKAGAEGRANMLAKRRR